MKRYGLAVLLILSGQFLAAPLSFAENQETISTLIINEIQTGSKDSASQEFIELYNTNDNVVALDGWHLQYASATSQNWDRPSRNIALSGTVPANGYFLLASHDYLVGQADISYSSTLSQSGGHVRLLDSSSGLQDLVGWGSAVMALGQPAPAPVAGQSLARPLENGVVTITDNNSTDFVISDQPSPKQDNVISGTATPETASTSAAQPTNSDLPASYDLVEITELLPNPAAPQTDAADEFVELYNPNAKPVDLSGYVIKSGSNDTYKYTIGNIVIGGGAYHVFYSRDTKLVLSNTAGRAKLFTPDGSLIDETAAYDKAGEGQSWILADGQWQWTSKPTPGQVNILSLPLAVAAASKASKTPSSTSAKKSSSTKKSAPKVKKASSSKKKAAAKTSADSSSGEEDSTGQAGSLHPIVLAGVGAAAVGYAAYEYRNDLANRIHKFRRYRAARATAGEIVKKS